MNKINKDPIPHSMDEFKNHGQATPADVVD